MSRANLNRHAMRLDKLGHSTACRFRLATLTGSASFSVGGPPENRLPVTGNGERHGGKDAGLSLQYANQPVQAITRHLRAVPARGPLAAVGGIQHPRAEQHSRPAEREAQDPHLRRSGAARGPQEQDQETFGGEKHEKG